MQHDTRRLTVAHDHLETAYEEVTRAIGLTERSMSEQAARRALDQLDLVLRKLQDEAVLRAKEYLRINTSNPPGNEVASMRWFAQLLKVEGIPFDTVTTAPGRGNIWARL